MAKCSQCRKATEELDTWWDRLRLKFFHLFHQDIIDLSQEKYTQGFGDGYKVGWERQKEISLENLKLLEPEPAQIQLTEFPFLTEIDKVLTVSGHKVLLNGQEVATHTLEDLKREAIMFENSLLWGVMTNTVKHQAEEIGWNKSKDTTDLMYAKVMVRTIDVLTNIVTKVRDAK